MKKRDTGPLFSFFGRIQKRVSLNFKNEEEGHRASFLVFWAHSKAVSLNFKNEEEGHRASFLVFWAHSEAVSLNFKNEEEGHRASFLVFWAHSEAVSLNFKNDAEGHRTLVKRRDARAGERHQLVGHQMNEQVRHRAVQALEGEPAKVARAGADATQRHLGHALGGKAGNEAVAQVAHAADVDVAHRVVVLQGSLHGVVWVLQAAQLHLRLQEAVLLPGCADGGHVLPRVGQQVDLGGHKRAHEFCEGARHGDVVLRHAVRDAGLLRVRRGVAEHQGPS